LNHRRREGNGTTGLVWGLGHYETTAERLLPAAQVVVVPGLATLVGYKTFWGSGNTVQVVQHLGIG
jgi:hypothetical protein